MKLVKNLVLVIAGILILFFVFRQHNPFGSRNSSFNVEEGREITRIELSSGNERLKLEKKGENWVVNGKYDARKSSITFIMRILKDVRIKSPVSPEKFDAEITRKEIKPVRVKAFGNSRLLKSFLVYKTSSNIYGNIMRVRERSKPFIVFVPGFDEDIGSAFTLNILFWQPFTVFNFLPSEISSVSLDNMADTTSSFRIILNKNSISLYGNGSELTGWDSSLVRRYLTYFTWIPFERWAFELSGDEKKLIESGTPATKITVTDRSGKEIVLTLWEKSSLADGMPVKDTDRLWGKKNNYDELFIIRYFDVDPVLKRRSYFFRR